MGKLLDFAHWKVKSHNNGKAVMTHRDGHFMTIATKHLPKLQQEQIKKLAMQTMQEQHLADGGKVADTTLAPAQDPEQAQAADAIAQPQAAAPVSTDLPNNTTTAPGTVRETLSQPAVNRQAEAITGLGKVAGELEGKKAEAYNNYEGQQEATVSDLNDDAAELKGHADDYANYVRQNPINPRRYFDSQSGGEKVATAIGLFLSGFGGQGRNASVDYLNKQVDNDIAAQRENSENQKNVWGAYHQLYGDQVIANNMTQVALKDQLANKINLSAAQLGTKQALLQAQKNQADTDISNIQTLGVTAQRLNAIKNGQIPPEPHPGAQQREIDETGGKDYPLKPFLGPDADKKYLDVINYDPQGKKQKDEITKQYMNAKQADKAIAALNQTFESLAKETNGISGRLHRTVSSNALGGVGALAGAGIGALAGGPGGAAAGAALGGSAGEGLGGLASAVTNTSANRAYDADQTRLIGDLNNSLKGLPIDHTQLEEIVRRYSPESGDSPELLKKKRDNIIGFIKTSVDHSLLDGYSIK